MQPMEVSVEAAEKKLRTLENIPEEPLKPQTLDDRRKSLQRSRSIVEKAVPKKRDSVIKSSDMPEDMQQEAVRVANEAMEKYRLEKDMATYIKEEFDRTHNPSWHCVVGRNFGSYVTHETNHFIYFYIQHIAIMLFKTGF